MADELDVLFPEKKVALPDGTFVTVKPLSLEDFPKVKDAFAVIMKLSQQKKSNVEMAEAAMDEILKILKYCLDVPAKKIPFVKVPEVIDIFLKQNLTDEAVGKWLALVQRVTDAVPGVDQST